MVGGCVEVGFKRVSRETSAVQLGEAGPKPRARRNGESHHGKHTNKPQVLGVFGFIIGIYHSCGVVQHTYST